MEGLEQQLMQFPLANVTLNNAGGALATLATIPNPGYEWLTYEYEVAAQALDDFDVNGRVQAVAAAQQKDYTIDWTADPPGGHRIKEYTSTGASENLAATPAGGNGYFKMRIVGLAEITIKARAAVNGAVVSHRYNFHNGPGD